MSRSKNELLLAASAFILLAAALTAALALRLSPSRATSTVQYTDGSAYGIDINSADKDELTALAGIGEKKAESIVSYREEHGEFIYPWEITNVDGIGEKTYEKIKNDICAD
mgnify:FL=1